MKQTASEGQLWPIISHITEVRVREPCGDIIK